MEIKELFVILLISIGGLILVAMIAGVFPSIVETLKSTLHDLSGKTRKLEDTLISKIQSNKRIVEGFKEIRICERNCFYNKNNGRRIFFIKPKRDKIRTGFLINYDSNKNKFKEFVANLSNLDIKPRRYEAIGMETGFLFIESEYHDDWNWEDEYASLIKCYGEKRVDEMESEFGLLSIEEYLDLISSKTEKSLKKY